MSAALDDEDLSLSITPSNPRRNSKDERKDVMPTAGGPPDPNARRTHHLPSTMSKRLGQYEIVRTLGEGSFGKVKLATHKVSGQRVALKIISRTKLVTRDMAGRIEREIQYLQLLRHPHIIKLYTVITTPREIVMVLEYAGGELFDYIVNHGRLPEDKARKFFQQIVCAVEYCHRHKIVHRDLKPENLLLDDSFNVKIADFGLSNIMTDGNFLKTSCGSPNYAAPEVISGKLYAGSEVDVWSCGVILYVLLTGRLPFDDEYIPHLFRKIQQGTYTVPNYMPKDAARLIKKMLQVNPVSRISIQEIRQDPWFTKDLAEYLKPPVEEFMDTGVDPNKAIDPAKLAPTQPVIIQEKLHDAVVGKLGKTMGYAKDDVREALAKDEPSAIKDAYLIVRENTIMKGNPSLTQNPGLQPFLSSSPTAYGSPKVGSIAATLPIVQEHGSSPSGADLDPPRHGSTASNNLAEVRSPSHSIGVLPSSLPSYHLAYMQGQTPSSRPEDDQEAALLDPDATLTEEQKAATARRLSPHSKTTQISQQKVDKPEAMTPIPSKDTRRQKPTKWQFGIRSRNSPSEAMLAIYKALKSMGACWEKPVIRTPGQPEGGEEQPPPNREGSRERRRHRQHEGSQSPEYSDSDPDAGTDPEYATAEERARRRARRERGQPNDSSDDEYDEHTRSHRAGHRRRHQPRGRDRYGTWNDWGYAMPQDPWIINARFRKDGMFAPGVAHPSSTRSSRVDLHEDALRRRSSTISASTSLHAGTPPMSSTNPSMDDVSGTAHGRERSWSSSTSLIKRSANILGDDSCWVYITIQLYCIEKDSYMVDFKCAGYERLAKTFGRKVQQAGPVSALASALKKKDDVGETLSSSDNDDDDDEEDDQPQRQQRLRQQAQLQMAKAMPPQEVKTPEQLRLEAEEAEEQLELNEGYEGLGRVTGEKDINSPFPFMDVASSLIVTLAQRD